MRCDKCKKIFEDNWTPGFGYPKYVISEKKSVMSSESIFLCVKCSQEFKKWVHGNEKQEED